MKALKVKRQSLNPANGSSEIPCVYTVNMDDNKLDRNKLDDNKLDDNKLDDSRNHSNPACEHNVIFPCLRM